MSKTGHTRDEQRRLNLFAREFGRQYAKEVNRATGDALANELARRYDQDVARAMSPDLRRDFRPATKGMYICTEEVGLLRLAVETCLRNQELNGQQLMETEERSLRRFLEASDRIAS